MRFSKVAINPEGICLLKIMIHGETPKLQKTTLNPENVSNLVEDKLRSDGIKNSISKESYAKFVQVVKNTCLIYPIEPIDNIIKSMSKITSQVIAIKGYRLKY